MSRWVGLYQEHSSTVHVYGQLIFITLVTFGYKICLVTNESSCLAFYVVDFSRVQGVVTSVNCWFYPPGSPRAAAISGLVWINSQVAKSS